MFKKSIIAALALVPTLATAEVTIDIPKGVQLLTVNQEDAGYSSLGFDYKDNLILRDGVNQVVFRISKIVFESGADKTKFKSEPLVATFNESDKQLKLEVPNIKTLDEGMAFNNNPSFQLKYQGEDLEGVKKDQLGLGFKLMPDMVQEVEKYNKSMEPASLKHFAHEAVKVDMPILEGSNYEVLKSAYESVSIEEKKKFLTWAISNME
ncbi:DUF2057 family protein [Vibrio maerlii]|uniref:DUF2057 family protein n=1 Tax=Vibrio maerlii TaxID=2231648 RepID=UPI000E3E7B3D|nr:DUF2057 family protein [Vibrio maerlii]